MAKRELDERIDGQLAIAVRAPQHPIAGPRGEREAPSERRRLRSLVVSDFGLAQALRAQATRATVDVRLIGSAPRGTEAAEEAVYFACSDAIQNAAKYAGDLGGTFAVASSPGHGTVLTLSLPWPAAAGGQR